MSALQTLDTGKLNLSTIEAQMTFASKLISERLISDTFKTPQQVLIGIQFCMSLNLDPMTGLKMMYVVHGKPALFGDGPLSLIQSSGKLDSIDEFWVDAAGEKISVSNKNLKSKPYAAICRIKRSGDDLIQEDFFTIDDMAQAGLKGNTWGKYTRTMMRYRARTQAIKSKFADVLNGMDIVEYISQDLPRENVRIDESEVIYASDEQIEKINSLVIETNTDHKKFLEFMKMDNFDNLSDEDAQRALIALNQKMKGLTEKNKESQDV